ncbi:reverse transcriptase domain-containing protein [Tanacetum coccineum]
MNTKSEKTRLSCEWKLYTDGAASSNCSSAGLMLIDPEGKEYTYALRFEFETTNNEAAYEALLVGLRIAQEMEIVSLEIFIDSQLLVNKIKRTYAAKQPTIREYLQKIKEALKGFDNYTIEHIRRNQNKKGDALSKLASMTFEQLTKEVLIEVLAKRSIEEKEILQVETKEEESWMTPIHEYLVSGLLPKDPKKVRKIRVKAPQATLDGGQNYEARILLAINAQRRPKGNSRVQKCKEQSAIRKAAENGAIAAGNGWSFSHWGVNILGPLPTAPGGFKFLAIAIEHSTKWVESKPPTTISRRHTKRFVWEYVVYRFGVPQTISSKDKKHFREGIFPDLCKGLKVTQSFSPITEHMEIMNHIEKQLTRSQQGWMDDLAQVLWVHRTLPRNSQKETPFSLTYDSEAIIPIAKNTLAKDDKIRTKEETRRGLTTEASAGGDIGLEPGTEDGVDFMEGATRA